MDSESWTIETLKEVLEYRLAESERKEEERFNLLRENINIEREAIDKRFEAANRYKETYQESLSRINNETLKREEANAKFSSIQEKIDIMSRTNWPVYSGFAGVVASIIVGLWVIIGLKIDATNQPVIVALEQTKIADIARDRSIADIRSDFSKDIAQNAADINTKGRDLNTALSATESGRADRVQLNERLRRVEAMVASSQEADAQSRGDRAQLNERIRIVEAAMGAGQADRRANESTMKAKLVEIETQLKNAGNVINLIQDNTEQLFSVLWSKVFPGQNLKGTHFRPTLHQESSASQ